MNEQRYHPFMKFETSIKLLFPWLFKAIPMVALANAIAKAIRGRSAYSVLRDVIDLSARWSTNATFPISRRSQ